MKKKKNKQKKEKQKAPVIPKYADEFIDVGDLGSKDIEKLEDLIGQSTHNDSVFKDVITIEKKIDGEKIILEKVWKESEPFVFIFKSKPYKLVDPDEISQALTDGIFETLDEHGLDHADVKITIQQDVICKYRRDM